jgi:hypothetical protein
MLTFDKFKLKENPFRVVPAINSKELIWAGFRGIKETFETRILRSMLIPNSAIVLNWGDYGSGKTHAARYFCKDNVMQELAERIDCQAPLSIMINFPRGKKVIEEIYTQIMDKIDIGYLRANIPEGVNINDCIKNSTDSVYIQKVLEEMFNDRSRTVEQVKAFLYGTEYPKDLVNVGITRKLNIETDAVDLLSALFNVITVVKMSSAVILWIDEFEDISLQNSTGINAANAFIKILLDKTPNRLLLFINFTLSAIASVESLGDYLQEAVKSRIVQRNELAYPNTADVLNYISELMNNQVFRTESVENPFTPFALDVVYKVISDLGSVSLRKYNETFSRLLDSAAFDEQETIDMDYYEVHKDEIITTW